MRNTNHCTDEGVASDQSGSWPSGNTTRRRASTSRHRHARRRAWRSCALETLGVVLIRDRANPAGRASRGSCPALPATLTIRQRFSTSGETLWTYLSPLWRSLSSDSSNKAESTENRRKSSLDHGFGSVGQIVQCTRSSSVHLICSFS